MDRREPHPEQGQHAWIALLGLALIPGIFLLDYTVQLGYAGGMPYVIPVVLGLWAPWRHYAPAMAGLATVLTAIGFFLSPSGGVLAVVLLNRVGAVTAVWVTALVVRHYKRVEAEVRRKDAKMATILATTVDGIITIDKHGIVESFNRAAERIFGYGADEVIGRDIKILMPEPYKAEHGDYIRRYLEGGPAKIIGIGREVEGQRKDGTIFALDLAVSEVEVEGAPIFTGTVRDITERKALERARQNLLDQLTQKNAELERFTYTVSHDLKSPLITIKGFLGMLEKDALAGNVDRLKKDMARIGAAADKMTQLLDELLELSRIGRIVNPPENVDLTELANECVALLAGVVEKAGVEVQVSPDLPTVYGDRIRLREVIQNLVENAVKFMGEQTNPLIEIDSRMDGAETVCFVRDNGVGVDPRYHEKVFGLFEQLVPDKRGTGVGLALVKRIIDVHGGRIWVESDGVGKGSCFCFILPEPEAAGSSRPGRDLQPE